MNNMSKINQKLKSIIDSKLDIKSAIKESGVSGVTDVLSTYANKIREIQGGVYNDRAYVSLKKIKDYLYETTYTHLDYDFAKKYFSQGKTDVGALGGCSAVRNGNFVGRNYDWTYSEEVSFIVKTPRTEGRYASISVTSSMPSLTKQFMESGVYYDEKFKLLPFMAVDGINEYGVVVNVLVTPNQYGVSTGTIPAIEVRDKFCSIMLPRYILDHFKTAEETVNYIKNYVSLYTVPTLVGMGFELHYMISDSNKSYLMESINNTIEVSDITNKSYLTNFYLHNVNFVETAVPSAHIPVGGVYTPLSASISQEYRPTSLGVQTHADGLERYNLIVEKYPTTNTKEGMRELLFASGRTDNLIYTNSYKEETNPFWYTEYCGNHDGGLELTVDSPLADFTDIIAEYREWYRRGIRDGKTWITEHSSLYDIKERKLYIIVQEDGEELEFNLEYYTKQEVDTIVKAKQDKRILGTASNFTVGINKIYSLGTIDGNTITLDDSGLIDNECANWHFFFIAGANAPVFGGGIDIKWNITPTFTSGKSYEIDILKVDNVYYGKIIERIV